MKLNFLTCKLECAFYFFFHFTYFNYLRFSVSFSELIDVKARERERLRTLEGTMKRFAASHEDAIAKERADADIQSQAYREKVLQHEQEIYDFEMKIALLETHYKGELTKMKLAWEQSERERMEEYNSSALLELEAIRRYFI